MTKTKKILLGSVLASVLSTTSMVQADGFFSKLFGNSSSDVDFKTMLSHVPADTAYLLGNKEAIPDDVMKGYMARSQEMFKVIADFQYNTEKKTDDKALAFYKAIIGEMSSKMKNNKFEDTGFSLKSKYVLYGYKLMPVMRMGIADKKNVMELLKRAEEKSGYALKLDMCGEFECYKNETDDGPKVAIVILEDHLAASVFSKETSTDVMNHLTGKAEPVKSYSEDKWEAFLKENNYKGYGDGFLNLKKIYNLNKDALVTGIFKGSKSKEISEDEMKACVGVIDDHVNNMPGIIFGITGLETASMDYEMVFQTSENVSNVLQEIANKTNIAKRSADPIFSMGLNLNAKKLGEAVTTYSNFLIKSGEIHKCKVIDAKKIRKSMGGMLMVMNMGLQQLKSIYVSLDNLKLDETMKPEKLDVFFSIGSDDPAGLLAMAAMMNPALADLKIPTDGSTVKLPASAIPSNGLPVPPISISRSDKAINFMMGNDKPDLKDYKSTKPEIMSFALDGKRYYEIMGNLLKIAPQSEATGTDTKELSDMMTSMGGMMGKIRQEVTADKRGLAFGSHVNY